MSGAHNFFTYDYLYIDKGWNTSGGPAVVGLTPPFAPGMRFPPAASDAPVPAAAYFFRGGREGRSSIRLMWASFG